MPSSGTMVVRVSPDDVIIYANQALTTYLGVDREKILGTSLESLRNYAKGEIAFCFERPEKGRAANRLVTDPEGRVFELKAYSEGGVLDILLDEVSAPELIHSGLNGSSRIPHEELTEDELRTLRHPERRFLTASLMRMQDAMEFAERTAPHEARIIFNAFLEEASLPVFENSSTVISATGEGLLSIFGAPRAFLDHPLRAVKCACEQMDHIGKIAAAFSRQGKELPPASIVIHSGDLVVGTIGPSERQTYSVVGIPLEILKILSEVVRPGEIILTDVTMQGLLNCLPPGWQGIRAESEDPPDLSDLKWEGSIITPLPPEQQRAVYLLGPGVEDDTSKVEYFFRYLYALQPTPHSAPIPVLSVVRPHAAGAMLTLDDENVVTSQTAKVLGKYHLLELIGRGGMGQVWRARDRFGNIVAIKVLTLGDDANETHLRRFRREAEIMARLPFRNICRIYEINEFEGITYIAMEYVEGITLADLIYAGNESKDTADLPSLIRRLRTRAQKSESRQSSPQKPAPYILPVEQTLTLIGKICDAVQFAHEHGVLHRDLKPGNILLREDGEPLVADFGLAKFDADSATYSLSISGHVVGTIENMAPEQAVSSKNVDERADVYSIGTILYQMLTGRKHFEAEGNLVIDAQKLQTHTPTPLRAINPAIDPDLEIITLKALRTLPEERYRSVAALKADLERYRLGEPIAARPVALTNLLMKSIRRNKPLAAVIAAAITMLFTLGIVSLWQINERRLIAEAAQREAERQRNEAEAARRQAEEERARAIAGEKETAAVLARLQQAMAEMERARNAADSSRHRSEMAALESLQEREIRERLEREKKAAEERLRAIEAEVARQRAAEETPPQPASNPTEEDSLIAARESARKAFEIFAFQFSPLVLHQFDRQPEKLLQSLSNAQNHIAQALLLNPTLEPAWILKARLHLAAGEIEAANRTLEEAATYRKNDSDPQSLADSQVLEALIADARSLSGDRLTGLAKLLEESGDSSNIICANVLRMLCEKPSLRKNLTGPDPFARQLSEGEIALQLRQKAGPQTRIEAQALPQGGFALRVLDASHLSDLSSLSNADVRVLELEGVTQPDWKTILTLPLEKLSLRNGSFDALPSSISPRNVQRIKELDLSGSNIQSLEPLRVFSQLENLDITNTPVRDLRPITGKRLRVLKIGNTRITDLTPLGQAALRELDLSGLSITTLAPLRNQPLEVLILNPELLRDKDSLQLFRSNRTLRILATPADPPDQSPSDFWQKFDKGAYNTLKE